MESSGTNNNNNSNINGNPPTIMGNETQSSHRISNKQPIMNGKINRNTTNNSNGDISNKNNESSKRKKSKARNATIPPTPSTNYQHNLDAWLENCLKDATGPQLSSSSEFLDYNTSSFNSNKNNTNQFLPKPNYPPFSYQGFQKNSQGLPLFANQHALNSPNMMYRNFKHIQNDESVEFASLPPAVNMISTGENYSSDNLENNPNRRFSDPCLVVPSDNESKASDKVSSEQQNLEKQIGNSKFLSTLLEQIKLLHETNSKICRNLQETKVEIEALKHASSWGLRHRRDSLSGLSTHSQPMGFAFGTQSPAPTYHSGVYTPGMMTDVVREVKEAARIREEALLSRVKSMVEERSWSIGEGNVRMMRDIEEMKLQIQHLRSDRKESNKRIAQLEAENKYMRSIFASVLNNRTSDIVHENELHRSTPIRKNVSDALRQKRSSAAFNVNYGIVHHDDGMNPIPLTDRNFVQKCNSMDGIKLEQMINTDHRNSFGKSDGTGSHNNSYRNEHFYAAAENDHVIDGDNVLQMEKETLDLRRELQEALASKKQAENKYIALERMVKKLEAKVGHQQIDNSTTNKLNGSTCPEETSQNNQSNFSQIASQIQTVAPKMSLAGPVTDL